MFFFYSPGDLRDLHSFPTRRSSDLPGLADEGLVVATIEADAFCHHMVRSLVGALMAVGEGRREQIWPQQILTARTRESAGRGGIGAAPMSPAQGLTLEGVEYPPDDRLAAQARATRVMRR